MNALRHSSTDKITLTWGRENRYMVLQIVDNGTGMDQNTSVSQKGMGLQVLNNAAYILENAFGIICRSGLHCAPLIHESLGSWPKGSVRASFSCLNKEKDAQHLISAVNSIAKDGKVSHRDPTLLV